MLYEVITGNFNAKIGERLKNRNGDFWIFHDLAFDDLHGKPLRRITSYNVCYTKLLRALVFVVVFQIVVTLCIYAPDAIGDFIVTKVLSASKTSGTVGIVAVAGIVLVGLIVLIFIFGRTGSCIIFYLATPET